MNATFHAPFPQTLDIRRYFEGHTSAAGVVIDRRGRARRRFNVDITGHVEDGALVLDEHFGFSDGATDRRVWRIEGANGHYSGTAGDVVGTARGTVEGASLRWRYDLMLPVGRRRVRVGFDDVMVLADHGTLLSRGTIRKFGLRWAEVVMVFNKRR